MQQRHAPSFALITLVGLAFGCSHYGPYRTATAIDRTPQQTDHPICVDDSNEGTGCPTASLIQAPRYLLGFVEFDELGWFWNRNQKVAVVDAIRDAAKTHDLMIVAYAHGWNHNADARDGNVNKFRQVLDQLGKLEKESARLRHRPERRIVGVYLGWRGAAFRGAGKGLVTLYNWTSFFNRRATARRVGSEDAAALLSELDDIRNETDRTPRTGRVSGYPTRLVVVGHSFGAAVVYNAVSRILAERRIHLFAGGVDAAAFGDLVVLVNPAMEASLLFPFEVAAAPYNSAANKSAAEEKRFHPILAIFASQGDGPNTYLFPFARRLATLFKRHRHDKPMGFSVPNEDEVDRSHFQGKADRTALGHFAPTVSFLLCPPHETQTDEWPQRCSQKDPSTARANENGEIPWIKTDLQLSCLAEARKHVDKFQSGDLNELQLSTSNLFRVRPGPMSPYPIVTVDRRLIRDHNDIFTAFFAPFLVDFVSVWSDKGEDGDSIAPAGASEIPPCTR